MSPSSPQTVPAGDALGSHVLLDLWGVDRALLDDVDGLRRRMKDAAERGGATVVDERFHRFSPHGVSGVVVLAESHVAIHTWPEKGFAALDVFTCGLPAMAERIADHLVASFGAEHSERQRLARGRVPAAALHR